MAVHFDNDTWVLCYPSINPTKDFATQETSLAEVLIIRTNVYGFSPLFFYLFSSRFHWIFHNWWTWFVRIEWKSDCFGENLEKWIVMALEYKYAEFMKPMEECPFMKLKSMAWCLHLFLIFFFFAKWRMLFKKMTNIYYLKWYDTYTMSMCQSFFQ